MPGNRPSDRKKNCQDNKTSQTVTVPLSAPVDVWSSDVIRSQSLYIRACCTAVWAGLKDLLSLDSAAFKVVNCQESHLICSR